MSLSRVRGVMVKRARHAVLVQLHDGPVGAEQAAAIRSLAKDGASVASACRSILLAAAGRPDLDVERVDAISARRRE